MARVCRGTYKSRFASGVPLTYEGHLLVHQESLGLIGKDRSVLNSLWQLVLLTDVHEAVAAPENILLAPRLKIHKAWHGCWLKDNGKSKLRQDFQLNLIKLR